MDIGRVLLAIAMLAFFVAIIYETYRDFKAGKLK